MRLRPPKIIRRLFPSLIWEIEDPQQNGIFLTFDDGPTPRRDGVDPLDA